MRKQVDAAKVSRVRKPRKPRSLLDELERTLRALDKALGAVIPFIDQVKDASRGYAVGETARLTLVLRGMRDAATTAKSSATKALEVSDENFARLIAKTGDITYREHGHSFTASIRGHFGAPPPSDDAAFRKVIDWCVTQGVTPWPLLVSKEAMTDFCRERLAAGKPIPPGVKEYFVPSITVRASKADES